MQGKNIFNSIYFVKGLCYNALSTYEYRKNGKKIYEQFIRTDKEKQCVCIHPQWKIPRRRRIFSRISAVPESVNQHFQRK